MMKTLLAILFMFVGASSLYAQEVTPEATPSPWCGYIMVGGVVIEEAELAMIGELAVTDEVVSETQDRLVARYNLNEDALIIEACWAIEPTRGRIASAISEASSVSYALIEQHLIHQVFANADETRTYLQVHFAEWEPNL